jgi:hypothetical protein
MGHDIAKYHPGQGDISDQFSRANIKPKTLRYFKQIFRNGDYTFGELTAEYYGLQGDELRHWRSNVGLYPKDVQNEIKRHVIHAMTRKDSNGNDDPTLISFKWEDEAGPKSITCTYDAGSPAIYTIGISGFPIPMTSAFADRRGKY